MDGPEACLKAVATWKRHVENRPSSTPLIESAADFLLFLDRKTTIAFYARGAKLVPRDPHWPEKLAFTHLLETSTDDRELQYTQASLSLKHYEQALALALNESIRLSNMYAHAAEAAWLADRNDKAGTWAHKLLKGARAGEWWFNTATHHGHTLLGLIALEEGNLALAKTRLMQSADVATSSNLGSFGPAMELAAALLDRGERDTVIEFFEATRQFWTFRPERIDAIVATLRDGRVPDELKYAKRKLAGRKPPKT
jgi:hypothetical protein